MYQPVELAQWWNSPYESRNFAAKGWTTKAKSAFLSAASCGAPAKKENEINDSKMDNSTTDIK